MKKLNRLASIVSLSLTLLLLISLVSAWYVTNTFVKASGITAGSADSDGAIIVKKTLDGEDISYSGSTTPTNKLSVTINDEKTKISPDSSGSFTFFVEYDTSSHSDSYTANIKFEIKSNQIIDESTSELALKYINSHIMIFKNYNSETGIFSDWISPSGADYQVTETDEEYAKEITVYWIWIGEFGTLYTDGKNTVIADDDLTAIRNYYNDNLDQMFESSEKSANGYNGADYIIGTSLKKIYFELTALKGA